MEDREDGIRLERLRVFESPQKGICKIITFRTGAERAFEQVMQVFHAVVEPKHEADLLEPPRRESPARGQPHLVAMQVLEDMGITFREVERKSAIRAGEMQRRYRARGAARIRTATDFIVGAHALLQCNALITRDAEFFRDYFKGLKVIVPKAD